MYIFLCISLLLAICNGQDAGANDRVCRTRNGYYKIDDSCDDYVECKNYIPFRMSCPDGLNFNPRANWPNYACDYPANAPCSGRGVSHPPKANANCPRQFGLFRSPIASAVHCDQYRICADGIAYDMYCPRGLAFNVATALCDWPENVPSCNSEAYLGFSCKNKYDKFGSPVTLNFRVKDNCKMFYSCRSGQARLLSCGSGFAFDVSSGRCVEESLADCSIQVDDGSGNSETTE